MHPIGYIFHPLLMATYSSGLLYLIFPQIFSPISPEAIPRFIGIIFLTTFIIPVISIVFLRFTNRITSYELTSREERILPFISITGFYGISTYLLINKLNLSDQLALMMVLVTALVGLILLISIRYKISVHAAGVWGAFGLFSALSIRYLNTSVTGYLAALVLIAGITSFSRMYLQKHSADEVWTGSILGFCFCFAGFYLLG